MSQASAVKETGCCSPFDPASWQDKEVRWYGKPFVRDHVRCLFHVPLDMGKRVQEDMARIHAALADVDQPLMLSDDKSPWGADLYIEVKRTVPGATMDHLSGTFLTKVFEGPFRDAGKWARQMKTYVADKGRDLEKHRGLGPCLAPCPAECDLRATTPGAIGEPCRWSPPSSRWGW